MTPSPPTTTNASVSCFSASSIQFPCVRGIAPHDLNRVDAEFLEPRDRGLGCVGRVSVPRHRVRENGDAADVTRLETRLSHGISLPGLRIPTGSRVCLTARSTCTPRSPISAVIQGRWSAPTAW